MALVKCSECGNEISTKAKTCPKCGAKVKRMGILGGIFWAMLAFLIYSGITGNAITSSSPPPKTPVQEAADKENSVRYVAVRTAMAAIQANLRNPSSVQWDSAYVNKDASTVCVQYRAQNGFGGMGRELFVVVAGNVSQSPAVWNK